MRSRLAAALAVALVCLALPASAQEVEGAEVALRLEDPRIYESSGLALSRRHQAVVWTHNDSGDEARLFAVGPEGRTLATLTLAGVEARDWEALAAGHDDRGRPALFVGDIGDNQGVWPDASVYRVAEPAQLRDATVAAARYRLRYADGGVAQLGRLGHPVDRHVGPDALVVADVADEQGRPAPVVAAGGQCLPVARLHPGQGEGGQGAALGADREQPRLVAAVVVGPDHRLVTPAEGQAARLVDPWVLEPQGHLGPLDLLGRRRQGQAHEGDGERGGEAGAHGRQRTAGPSARPAWSPCERADQVGGRAVLPRVISRGMASSKSPTVSPSRRASRRSAALAP